jgi:hypothetical protein
MQVDHAGQRPPTRSCRHSRERHPVAADELARSAIELEVGAADSNKVFQSGRFELGI